ncbi:hypothetical protein A2856_02900 [Candidatus Uhrbacteria bacterium RIFCSPHIGHO2_01_FULL_63_20]|uniref:histidine kinase n=1 Tax=Candidatus Uhrbacteria bacterium RIFCSPHIGHO2_01_FULL_63_20 TaxID=1802385 RepID=A0A1F7TM22_9BACT|nr:MAG: hypothetical protein A2856_02900 [Candidatus Uhrbacteria bacterium RIFCSPHIGHO2_01_FULL_63_20]
MTFLARSFRFRLALSFFTLMAVSTAFFLYLFFSLQAVGIALDAGGGRVIAAGAIEELLHVSFLFVVALVLTASYAVSTVIATVRVSLSEILKGIAAFGRGDLRHRVCLASADEFGRIAKHLNAATREVERSRAETERLRREYAAMLVHELRSPLTNVRWAAESLGDGVKGEAKETAATIGASVSALLETVNDFLDASKIEAGKFEVVLKPADLAALVRERVREFAPSAKGKGLALRLGSLPKALVLPMDEKRIGQVVNNFLSNAVKFTERGSVSLSVGRVRNGKAVRVSVTDTGPGIPEEARGKLFRKFSQLEAGTAQGRKGTGLGLSVVAGIMEAHRGGYGVDSEEGKGSAFWFELPVKV